MLPHLNSSPKMFWKQRFSITTLGGWYRAQEPLNPADAKKLRKIYKIPHTRVGDFEYKKNTEKIWKRPKNYHCCIFSYFGGPPLSGGFCIFFVFPGFRGFWALCHLRRIVSLANHGNSFLQRTCATNWVTILWMLSALARLARYQLLCNEPQQPLSQPIFWGLHLCQHWLTQVLVKLSLLDLPV